MSDYPKIIKKMQKCQKKKKNCKYEYFCLNLYNMLYFSNKSQKYSFYIEDCSHYISHVNNFYSHYKYLTCNTMKLSTFEKE